MGSKLTGFLPLQDMIKQQIESAREKLAAAEEKEEKKANPFAKKEEKKKTEEEDKEKKSSVIDSSDPSEIEKLAEALDELAEDLVKEADSIENGGESPQGGQQLATMSRVPGKQVYTGAKAHHQVPTQTGLEKKPEAGPARTAVPDTQHNPPVPLSAGYPKKGVLKTAEFPPKKDEKEGEKVKKLVEYEKKEHGKIPSPKEEEEEHKDEKEKKSAAVSVLQAALAKMAAGNEESEKDMASGHRRVGAILGGLSGAAKGAPNKEKKSEAVEYILNKVAEVHGGGETLDSAAGQGPKPPSQPGRQLIANNKAPVNATKREAKSPVKKPLSEVLTEPALTSSTDNTVQQNLRNASKGGVKIAMVKEYFRKLAEAGCLCNGKGECDFCRAKASIEKKREARKTKQSLGMGPSTASSTTGTPTPMPGSLPM